MDCRACGNKEARRIKTVWGSEGPTDTCDKCGKFSCSGKVFCPDVWYGYGSGEHSEENIAYPNGHERAGEPIPFHDRQSKLAAMKLAGIHEAGDRRHGARPDYTKRKIYG